MRNIQLKSRLHEMIESLDEIISGVSGQTRELKELIKFREELKELIASADTGYEVDWNYIVVLMTKFVEFLYSFSSE